MLLEFVNVKLRKVYMKDENFQGGSFELPGSTRGLGKPGPASDTEQPVLLGSQERPCDCGLLGDFKAATGSPGKAT